MYSKPVISGEEEGLKAEAVQVSNQKFKLTISKGGQTLNSSIYTAFHPTIFGIDVEDYQGMDKALSQLMDETKTKIEPK